jgi:hypothetical protein
MTLSGEARIFGVDFTSAPRRRKPIMVACARARPGCLQLERIDALGDFQAFEALLATPGPWVGGFDFPFGLPRELLLALNWPGADSQNRDAWALMVRHLQAMPRSQMVSAFRAWCDARPPGSKFAHRAVDRLAGSSPSMKWVNPPVAFMLQAGAPRLLAADVCLPGQHVGDPQRIALEAYPGMIARSIIGRRSYKSDQAAAQTSERAMARREIIAAIEAGDVLGLPVILSDSVREQCVDDGSADALDAVLCALQAAWAFQRQDRNFGLPNRIDPIEGWIATVPDPETSI